jgi:hypothetical protein
LFLDIRCVRDYDMTEATRKEHAPSPDLRALLVLSLTSACGQEGLVVLRIVQVVESPQSPDDLEPEIAATSYDPDPGGAPSDIAAVKERNEARLLAIDGVEGVAIGRDQIGRDAILVFVRDSSVESRLPTEIEGFSVIIDVTGEIRPL